MLVLPIALLAHADDHDISELRHTTPLDGRLRLLGAYDPTGEKAKAVKRRYQGVCAGCGAPTKPRNGKNDRYEYCKACHPGAIATQWTTERVRDVMRAWQHRYGRLPSSYDWSRTHAVRRGAQALERFDAGDWPPASVVGDVFGTWKAARAAAGTDT